MEQQVCFPAEYVKLALLIIGALIAGVLATHGSKLINWWYFERRTWQDVLDREE